MSYSLFFTFGAVDKVGGDEINWARFILNVSSSITFFVHGNCECLNVGITLGSINNWRSKR